MIKTFRLLLWSIGLLGLTVLFPGQRQCVWAVSPWWLVSEYGEQDPQDPSFNNTNYYYFATHNMLTDTPIRYAIELDDYPGRTEQTDEQWIKKTDTLIRAAFSRWPNSVARMIRSSGRAREFQDVLDTFTRHPLILERTDKEKADILFHFDTYKSADFLYDKNDLSKQKTIRMENPALSDKALRNLPHFLAHEIGHYYGLGDRYQEGISGSSPLYSTTEGTDSTALMATAKGPELTKDDVDGFINLMDVTQAFASRKFNARAEKGWVSFDSKSRLFARGKELNRMAFFDGNTIYYYNKDGSIRSKKTGRTVGGYNPLAETRAQQGPFESVQHVVSDDTDLETFFDYTQLPQGHFRGKSIIANLTMLTFTGKRTAPHKWNLQFDYERTIDGFNEKRQQLATVQVLPDTCRVYIAAYDKSMKNLQAQFNPQNGQFSLQGTALDLPEDDHPYHIQASGTETDAQFTYTQGENAYRMLWKNDSFYPDEETESYDFSDQLFFVTDNISWLRKILSDEHHFCKYLRALENNSTKRL